MSTEGTADTNNKETTGRLKGGFILCLRPSTRWELSQILLWR